MSKGGDEDFAVQSEWTGGGGFAEFIFYLWTVEQCAKS